MSAIQEKKKQINIVVVDDSEFSRKTIGQILTEDGYNVVGDAGSAKDAVKVMGTVKIHLMIIDVVLPEVSGIEFAEQIKENFKDMAIVMISSLRQEQIVIESISAGAWDFIQKPFSPSTLLDSIERVAQEISLE